MNYWCSSIQEHLLVSIVRLYCRGGRKREHPEQQCSDPQLAVLDQTFTVESRSFASFLGPGSPALCRGFLPRKHFTTRARLIVHIRRACWLMSSLAEPTVIVEHDSTRRRTPKQPSRGQHTDWLCFLLLHVLSFPCCCGMWHHLSTNNWQSMHHLALRRWMHLAQHPCNRSKQQL